MTFTTALTRMNARSIAKLFTPPIVVSLVKLMLRSPAVPRNAGDVAFLLPERELCDILPGIADIACNMSIRLLRGHEWAMPENETIVLAAISRFLQPRKVLEFGTFTGGSTLAFAMNTPSDSQIVTLDVDPSNRATHRHGMGVGLLAFDTGTVFRGSQFAEKIQQCFVSTLERPSLPLQKNSVDLVFIDADHTYPFVMQDTKLALEYLRPGGAIIWHDYRWPKQHPECAGVTRCVNEFYAARQNCYQISGTRFAIYISM